MSIVIDADKLWKAITTNHDDYIELGELGELIYDGEMEAPTAQKTGRWEIHILRGANVNWGYDCSACGEWFVIGNDYIKRYNYCPHCGARMVGDTDDEI